jgi:hypothetical protein
MRSNSLCWANQSFGGILWAGIIGKMLKNIEGARKVAHMNKIIGAFIIGISGISIFAAEPVATTKPQEQSKGQQEVLHETDPASPRHTRLKSTSPSDEIVRTSIENDGHPDVLERWWNGKRCRWIDENHDMRPNDMRGDLSADSLQIDNDGDGYYDGPGDMNVKWVDDDGDGRADAEIVAINPSSEQKTIRSSSSHYMIYVDVDHDGVNAYVDWKTFDWTVADDGNWRTTGKGNYSPDYNGDSIFLKQHLPAAAVADPRFNWENPFAFYDFDHDGCSEMAIRLLDRQPGGAKIGSTTAKYSGKDTAAFMSFDLDNDSQKDNEFDFDMSIHFTSEDPKHPGDSIDYSKYSDKHKIRAPKWVLDAHLFRYDNYRKIDDWCYVTHDKCYEEIWKTKWGQCWMCFDEDDDDHRWERVEMYYPGYDVYSTGRWKAGGKGGISGHGQADNLGDRGEWDMDNSGRGKMYVGKWDQKLHLLGAESGAWLVDYGGKYWGGHPVVVGGSSKEDAPHVEEVVQYKDTDNNGFIDEITYDYDGDKAVDLKINLLDFKDEKNPHPDESAAMDPGELKWQGLHEEFTKISEDSFQQALVMYRAAWKAGLTTPELDDLAIASSTGEKYDHGYWLKEKIFRVVDKQLEGEKEKQTALRKAFFLGDYSKVVGIIGELNEEKH